MPFLKKRDITKELDALCAVTLELPRGSVVEYAAIEEAAGIGRHEPAWHTLICKWKQAMVQNNGIWVRAVPGVGYRYMSVQEQLSSQPERYEAAARRRLRQAMVCAGSISSGELDPTQMRYQSAIVDQFGSLAVEHKKHSAVRMSWLQAPESMPRAIDRK